MNNLLLYKGILRTLRNYPPSFKKRNTTYLLKKRFATGDIDKEEYQEKRSSCNKT
jgi:uncharacterized membrane protein